MGEKEGERGKGGGVEGGRGGERGGGGKGEGGKVRIGCSEKGEGVDGRGREEEGERGWVERKEGAGRGRGEEICSKVMEGDCCGAGLGGG